MPSNTRRLVCAGVACALAPLTFAAAPDRTPSGATLVVPAEHASLGTVYFVEAGPDVQVTFTSDAPVERIVGTSSAVVGYAVVADDPATAGAPIVAGAFADWTGDYRMGFTILASLSAVGSLFFLMAKPPLSAPVK